MSQPHRQSVSPVVAYATFGTFVVMTIVFGTILLRTTLIDTAHDQAADASATAPRKHATVFPWPAAKPAEKNGATKDLETKAPAVRTPARASTIGVTQPSTGPDLAANTQFTLPAYPSPLPETTTAPNYATPNLTLPIMRAPSLGVTDLSTPQLPYSEPTLPAEGPLPALEMNANIAPGGSSSPAASIIPGPPTSSPPASVMPSSSLPIDQNSAAAPQANSQLPPSPWSKFVATFGSGHFTEQGTITLADVRMMALRNNKDIAVLGNLPHIADATAGVEEAIFDPVFTINPVGGRYNRQTANQVQSLGNTSTNVLKTGFLLPGSSLNQVYVEKLFTTGGKLQVGVGQNFAQVSPAGTFVFVNPAWQSSVNFIAEQPLFRGRGPNWNEAPIRIARANQSQSQYTFQATVNQVLRDAETAYWDAYAAYQDFEVRRMASAQALETVDRERGRLRLGEGSVPDVAQAEEQAEAFQIAQAVAENRLIDAQRTLRRLMGIAPDDPRPIVPATAASDAPVVIGWEEVSHQAMTRPEFGAQRAIVEAAEIEVCRRRNGLLPDISVRAIYSITGLDNHWDEAWSSVGSGGYNDWTVGAVYKQPLGRRADNSLAQRAAATLSFESAKLRQLEHEVLHQLNAACQNVVAAERLLGMHRRRREAAAIQLDARRELYLENRASLRDELDAEVRYASAVLDESIARVNYQRTLTDWNYARGAISADDVVVSH